MIKAINKVGLEVTLALNIMKTVYGKSIANIVLNEKKTDNFPCKVRNKTKMSIFTTVI